SEIIENIPNQFVSIRSYGILKGDTEITSGEEVEKWFVCLNEMTCTYYDKTKKELLVEKISQ
ncbi:MAG TPA: DUF1398 family protein, partial [Flavobacterium sp.]|nr:DUF1398 family protein [Flavobacterium sp.]